MLRESRSARKAWETLRTFFVQKNLHNRVQLRNQLHDFEMAPDENLMDHLMRFEDLFLRLTGVGQTVTDDEKLVILLGSLPAEYDGMIRIIEAHGSVTLLDAKEMLRREYETVKKREKQEKAFEAVAQDAQGSQS
ncbi:polyprotein [Plasmopara halstedii]|uniref:Polyprotein n=1 Tax=Plasmopara halstedii TaxID=4781 RepID=A0A0P1A5I2_PLAHL|nr:polyprotein [Plasmopara halstedii]CEG35399.1 polyprotein [Plasmopara halstedii]|eukprot:XP_024571768.1 polyprotein [Plasmopara halstedii]